MQHVSLHNRQSNSIAKQLGFAPSYWSMLGNGFSNDRTPEISQGSIERDGITKV